MRLALGWLRAQEQAHGIILGASRIEQLEENLAAFESDPLSDDVLAACEPIWDRLRGPTPNYNR